MKQGIYSQEKIHLNLARLKKGGGNFEIVIDPDKAIQYLEGKEDTTLDEVLKSQDIFFDAKKGEHASEERIKELFKTENKEEVIKKILSEGEIQLTAEHRAKIREEKKKQIIQLISRNTCDPKTKLPHPPTRIQMALEQGKIKIDEFKKPEDQINDIIKALRPIIPLAVETRKIRLTLTENHASRLYGNLRSYGKIIQENWQNNGSWEGIIELPAGIVNEFFEKINSQTHGEAQTEIIN